MNYLYIIAGNASEAAEWCKARKIPLSSVIYIRDEVQLRGLKDVSYVIVGTFWDRPDAGQIYLVLQAGQTHRLVPPTALTEANKQIEDLKVEVERLKATLAARTTPVTPDPIPEEMLHTGKVHFKKIRVLSR